MTVGNLLSVLRSLCETDPPEISWQGIVESEKRADLETLVNLGALVNVGNNDGILCLACDEPHSVPTYASSIVSAMGPVCRVTSSLWTAAQKALSRPRCTYKGCRVTEPSL